MVTLIEKRCENIMTYIKKNGNTDAVSLPEIQKAIRMTVGSNKETVKTYCLSLVEFGYLKQRNLNIFEIVSIGNQ